MSGYFITTDLTADFPQCLKEDEFLIMPMSYVMDGVVYDGKETPYLSSHDFYTLVEQGKTPTTSRVPVEEAHEFFTAILAKGKDILHISFSSALSGSYEGYLQAAEKAMSEYPDRKVVVVDSKCASAGEGLLCYYALKKRREGATLEENAEYVTDLREHIGHAFTVNDLYHLYRGGRLSKGAAIVGQAIKLKPVLMVDENGALVNISNVLGRKIAVRSLVDKMEHDGANYKNDVVIIAHADCPEDAALLEEKINERFGKQNIVTTDIGAIIGSHCGKGVLALFYLAENKTDRRI